eukprot:GHVT01096069.1.p2 GENE.GHVT01096069.1~~GHVT01096069.1.p2  ORF type:complete len:100 (-),score=12.36 GHVT01096069.1:677-976(-)
MKTDSFQMSHTKTTHQDHTEGRSLNVGMEVMNNECPIEPAQNKTELYYTAETKQRATTKDSSDIKFGESSRHVLNQPLYNIVQLVFWAIEAIGRQILNS